MRLFILLFLLHLFFWTIYDILMIAFRVQIEPVLQQRHRSRKFGGMYDPSVNDKREFLAVVDGWVPVKRSSKALRVGFIFAFKRPKSHYRSGKFAGHLRTDAPVYHTSKKDIDNAIKFYLDAMNGVFYEDDGQVVELMAEKCWDEVGSVFIKIEEI